MKRRYYTGRNVEKAISIEELRHMAKRRVPSFAYEFIEGGAEDELSLAWNREAFAALRFVPQTLVDTSQRHTRVTLFGVEQPSPLVVAPSGHNDIYRRGADMMPPASRWGSRRCPIRGWNGCLRKPADVSGCSSTCSRTGR
jgi:(S)-mandelate dehydrogenase